MSLINFKAIRAPSPEEFIAKYYHNAYQFQSQLRNVIWAPQNYETPLPISQFLQTLFRPVWLVSYEGNDGSAERFRSLMMQRLRLLNAEIRMVPKSGMKAAISADPGAIFLSHHTTGRKLQQWHYKIAYLPDFYHFDRDGYSGWSEPANDKQINQEIDNVDPKLARAFFDDRIMQYRDSGLSKYAQSAASEVVPQGFVFIALQLLDDAVMRLSYHKDYLEAMAAIVTYLRAEGRPVVLKRHPKCASPKVAAFMDEMVAQGAIASDASIHKLLPAADLVVTQNSGVGFEALTWLKPVICIGKADYGPVVGNADSIEAFRELYARVESWHSTERILKFLFLILRKYQVDVSSETAADLAILRALAWYGIEQV